MKRFTYALVAFVAVLITLSATVQAQTLVSDWGRTTEGFGEAWANGMLNDGSTPAGDASITGVQPMPGGTNGASLRGGFDSLEITVGGQAVVVSGQLEYVGGGMGDVYTPLRFAVTYIDSLSLTDQYTDSARWVSNRVDGSQNHHYGYEFTPRTGTGTQPNGGGGNGSVWTIINGNWASTYSNGGGPIGDVVDQAPLNAEISVGTYDFAISVQAIDDTTNEVRWSLVKTDNSYWFAGTVIDTAVTTMFNGVLFWIKDGDATQFNVTGVTAGLGDPIEIPVAPFEAYYLGQWGRTTEGFGEAWPNGMLNDSNTVNGNAGIAGVQPMPAGSNGASLLGGFGQDVNIPTDEAVVVWGQIEYAGGGMGDIYTPLRFAVTYIDSLSLTDQYTDSARWVSDRVDGSQNHHYGYEFTPRTGTGTQPNGGGGNGSVWTIINGNWASTYSNGGGPIGDVVDQAPLNAEISEGVYNFAVSVQQIDDTTNEVRWLLIKEDNSYWFAGTVQDTTVTDKLNGIAFWIKDGDVTQFNVIDAQIDKADPIEIPEAPFEAYYLGQWGRTTDGFGEAWPNGMLNDSNTVNGNAGIAGVQPMPAGSNGASLRGGFGQDVTIPSDEAVVVWGQLEYVGSMGDVYTPLRFAVTYIDSLSLTDQYTDSARWVSNRVDGSQNHHYGYEFTPRTGTGTQPNGTGGNGSVWPVNNGNWASTYSNGGAAIGPVVDQAPLNAEISEGVYNWAVSVQQVNDSTNEVRWLLVKEDNSYWFAGTVWAPALTDKLNGIAFWIKDGEVTQFNVIDAQIDKADPIEIPLPPFEPFYVGQWGFIGGRTNGWTITPDLAGNVSMSGNALTDWAAIRGGFDVPAALSADTSLVITGEVEFVGGGFEAWSSLRMGVFYSDSAGTLVDTSWSGTENNSFGYLFLPHSGTNDLTSWQGIGQNGTVGAPVDRPWISTNGANDYVLSEKVQEPAEAVGSAGTYEFGYSFTSMGAGMTEIRYYLSKDDDSYHFKGIITDDHDPLVTEKFNGIYFAVNNSTTTGLNLVDVYVELGDPLPDEKVTPVESEENLIPTAYALSQNYPNPFNPTTTINFALPKTGDVKLAVYDILGRKVADLVNGNLTAGYHTINFNASNLASGVYFYRIEAGDFVSVKKLMLLK